MPIVEVHLSNIDEREEWRRAIRVEPRAHRVLGRGPDGYREALVLPGGRPVERDDVRGSPALARALEEPLLVTNLVNVRYLDGLRQLERRGCSSTRTGR